MSENEERAPLTRRERRLREQAATGALNLSELSAEELAAEQSAAATENTVPAAAQDEADDIEISPVNPDGTPRTRREMRILREQALAARQAARESAEPEPEAAESEAADPEIVEPETADPDAAEPEAVEPEAAEPEAVDPETAEPEVVEAEVVAADPETEEPETEEPQPAEPEAADIEAATPVEGEAAQDFDSLISPPTEPFTVEELREAESTATEEPEPAASSEAAPEPKTKRKFWKLGKETPATQAPAAEESETASESEVTETAVPETAPPAAEPVAAEPVAEEPVAEELVPAEPAQEREEPAPVEPVATTAAHDEPVSDDTQEAEGEKEAKASYSFPDITPPEEWRSVFDDPATRNVPASPGEPQGDFDDLISRAVAQEGSTNGTSALILPAMPEDTGGLTGPLGATGELYVTGSMRLPKSLGETGGHVPLHESAEVDPITGAVTEDEHGTVVGPAPVSARHAVSARVVSGVPAVAKPAREKRKLPLVLGLTGGGLLVVVVGVGVWGAMNGFFG